MVQHFMSQDVPPSLITLHSLEDAIINQTASESLAVLI